MQKVIKIGSSYGVTLPKKQLLADNIKLGDTIDISYQSIVDIPNSHDVDVYKMTQKLIARHKNALKNLAQR